MTIPSRLLFGDNNNIPNTLETHFSGVSLTQDESCLGREQDQKKLNSIDQNSLRLNSLDEEIISNFDCHEYLNYVYDKQNKLFLQGLSYSKGISLKKQFNLSKIPSKYESIADKLQGKSLDMYQEYIPYDTPIGEIPITELKKFRLKLDLMSKVIPDPVIPYSEIWKNSLEKKDLFAEELKSVQGELTFQYWCKKNPILKSYNHIYPYRHLPNWDYEVDDMEYRNIPVVEDKFLMRKYKKFITLELKKVLKNKSFVIPEIDVAKDRFYNSVSFDFDNQVKKGLCDFIGEEWKVPNQYLFARCKIKPFPAGGRDTVISDWKSGVLLRWGELAYSAILPFFKESVIGVSPTLMSHRMEKFFQLKGTFLMRDYKKCGLTYNYHLLKILGKEMFKLTKNELFLIHGKLFNSQLIYDIEKKEYCQPKRGYGLGMANHLATLSMILTYRYCCKIMKREHKAVFFNDDSCIHFEKQDIQFQKNYILIEERLGNIINRDKTTWSIAPILLEQYGSRIWEDSKISLICCELVDIMFIDSDDYKCIRINECLNRVVGTRWESFIQPLYSYGCKSFKNERLPLFPFALGGACISHTSPMGTIEEIYHCKSLRREVKYLTARRQFLKRIMSKPLYSYNDQKYKSRIPKYFQSSISCSWTQEKKRLKQMKYLSRDISSYLNKKFSKKKFNLSMKTVDKCLLAEGIILPELVQTYSCDNLMIDSRNCQGIHYPDPFKEWRLCKFYGGDIPVKNIEGYISRADFDNNVHQHDAHLDKIIYPEYGEDLMNLPGYGIDAVASFYEKYKKIPQSLTRRIKTNNLYHPCDLIVFSKTKYEFENTGITIEEPVEEVPKSIEPIYPEDKILEELYESLQDFDDIPIDDEDIIFVNEDSVYTDVKEEINDLDNEELSRLYDSLVDDFSIEDYN